MMHDLSQYVGLPYVERGRDRSGVDCWGLPVLAYRELLGIELPHYVDAPCIEERAELDTLIASQREAGPWRTVERPQALDVALMRVGGYVSHVGLWDGHGRVLHAFARRVVLVPVRRLPGPIVLTSRYE